MKCTIENCENLSKIKGVCFKHYQRYLRHGTYDLITKEKLYTCTVIGCEQKVDCNKVCATHNYRFKKYGSYELPKKCCAVENCTEKFWGSGFCRKHYRQNYKKTHRHEFKFKYKRGYDSAKERGLDWKISFEDYCDLIKEKLCFYCTESFEHETGHNLDRIVSELSYTKTNVVPCCGTCNMIRSNRLTHGEMKVAMQAVKEYRTLNK